MHIKHLLIVSSFSLLLPIFVSAIDTTTSGRILDDFKEGEYKILFESLPFTQTGSKDMLEQEYRMNGLEGLKKKLQSIRQAYSDQKDTLSNRRLSLESSILALDQAIENTEQDIANSESSILAKRTQIQEYQNTSLRLKRKIAENRAIILQYLTSIHSETSLLMNDENHVDIFQTLILSDGSTDSIATDITYKSLVSQLGQKFVDEYRALIKQNYTITLSIKEDIEELKNLEEVLSKNKNNLSIQKKERQKILDITKGQEENFQKYIESQKKAEESVEKSWQDASNAYSASLDKLLEKNGCIQTKKVTDVDKQKCEMMKAFYRNERALKSIEIMTGSHNIMQWPVKGEKITTYFRDPEYFRSLGSQHDAIDIAVEQGSDVYAALDGYVYYILPPVEGGYSYIALRHPDGYVTVYGHLSEVNVLPYQFVTKGQLIAKSGGAPGTPGAGPMTSGAHLHFELWHNTESVDPLSVLSLSTLDYDELPSRYQQKFLDDIVESFGSGANVNGYEVKFKLKGNSEADRQKYLLKTYATPDFQSWDMWVDTALENKIDPSFLMCVGLAETTLGNRLKTQYNVGNIGNTDSGSVYVFESPTEGVEWMTKTFNNKYLSKYSRVSDLSRWGNDNGTIYASSNANWHDNIMRCLGALKGKYVDDDYNFRMKN